jgi:hypothetical protein
MTHIKPRPGLRVRDPQTGQPLPDDGKEVVMDAYWTRRLNDGDVTQTSKGTARRAPATPPMPQEQEK